MAPLGKVSTYHLNRFLHNPFLGFSTHSSLDKGLCVLPLCPVHVFCLFTKATCNSEKQTTYVCHPTIKYSSPEIALVGLGFCWLVGGLFVWGGVLLLLLLGLFLFSLSLCSGTASNLTVLGFSLNEALFWIKTPDMSIPIIWMLKSRYRSKSSSWSWNLNINECWLYQQAWKHANGDTYFLKLKKRVRSR